MLPSTAVAAGTKTSALGRIRFLSPWRILITAWCVFE